MKILFRADSNEYIGQGHVMRCMSLADAFSQNGAECILAYNDTVTESLIKDRNIKGVCLKGEYDKPENELPVLTDMIKKENIDLIIIDSYYVTPLYLNSIRQIIKTVYIDDVYSFAYPVDVLVNYNIYADADKYRDLYLNTEVKLPELILNSHYAPLRKEFQNKDGIKNIGDNVESVMITFGGSDPLHLAKRLLSKFVQNYEYIKNIRIDFILGKMEQDIEEIRSLSEEYENINIYVNVSNMADYIKDADMTVSASGSTLYEICACQRSGICFSMADNQMEGAKKFNDLDAFIYIGDARENEHFEDDLFAAIVRLCEDVSVLKRMALNASKIADGFGAEHLACRLLKETE